jgi:hypothetical protein
MNYIQTSFHYLLLFMRYIDLNVQTYYILNTFSVNTKNIIIKIFISLYIMYTRVGHTSDYSHVRDQIVREEMIIFLLTHQLIYNIVTTILKTYLDSLLKLIG